MGIDPEEAEDHVCEPGAPAWLATMGDLMSLLLTFFVLMLSFANMDKQLFMDAMGSVQEALGLIKQNSGQFQVNSNSLVSMSEHKTTPFLDVMQLPTEAQAPTMSQRMMQQLQQSISENNLGRIVEAESSERGVIVRVKGQALFRPGSDELLPESFQFLDEIVRLAQEFPYPLSVEGHSDNSAIHSPRFGSNWHLSAARAIQVLRYLADAGGIAEKRLAAVARGSTRPLVANDSPEHRAINRRVEFVFLRDPKVVQEKRVEKKARERQDRS